MLQKWNEKKRKYITNNPWEWRGYYLGTGVEFSSKGANHQSSTPFYIHYSSSFSISQPSDKCWQMTNNANRMILFSIHSLSLWKRRNQEWIITHQLWIKKLQSYVLPSHLSSSSILHYYSCCITSYLLANKKERAKTYDQHYLEVTGC